MTSGGAASGQDGKGPGKPTSKTSSVGPSTSAGEGAASAATGVNGGIQKRGRGRPAAQAVAEASSADPATPVTANAVPVDGGKAGSSKEIAAALDMTPSGKAPGPASTAPRGAAVAAEASAPGDVIKSSGKSSSGASSSSSSHPGPEGGIVKKRGRPLGSGKKADVPKRPRGRPRTKPPPDPNVPPKPRGRPRKEISPAPAKTGSAASRVPVPKPTGASALTGDPVGSLSADVGSSGMPPLPVPPGGVSIVDDDDAFNPIPRRGRPPGSGSKQKAAALITLQGGVVDDSPKRPRGRPAGSTNKPKKAAGGDGNALGCSSTVAVDNADGQVGGSPVKRGPGRPKKEASSEDNELKEKKVPGRPKKEAAEGEVLKDKKSPGRPKKDVGEVEGGIKESSDGGEAEGGVKRGPDRPRKNLE